MSVDGLIRIAAKDVPSFLKTSPVYTEMFAENDGESYHNE